MTMRREDRTVTSPAELDTVRRKDGVRRQSYGTWTNLAHVHSSRSQRFKRLLMPTTTRSKAPPKAPKAPAKRDKENAKPSNAMNAKPSANVKPSKKGAGTKANTAAIPTISEMKAKLDEEASRGLDAYVQRMELNNNWVKASDPKLAEKEELADLAFMGIRGQTPGGSRWRTRVTTNKVPIAPMAVLTEECHI